MKFLVSLWISCLWSLSTSAADWPEGPWVNGSPGNSAVVSAVAFVSPVDLQFQRMMHIWKKLEKRYGIYNVEFILIAMQEPLFPFSENLVQGVVKESSYSLPVYVDGGARYSKLWRAYVSPTVNLVLKNGKVTSFDPGNFDPFVFEKSLQRLLKESGAGALPPREFASDVDLKNCHPHTVLVGNKFTKAFSSTVPIFDGAWDLNSYFVEKTSSLNGQMELPSNKSEVGLLAESRASTSHVYVSLDGQKIPTEIRGRDVLEDKSGSTYVNVLSAKMYEILAHPAKAKENSNKLVFSTDSPGLKVWSVEFIPSCMESVF